MLFPLHHDRSSLRFLRMRTFLYGGRRGFPHAPSPCKRSEEKITLHCNPARRGVALPGVTFITSKECRWPVRPAKSPAVPSPHAGSPCRKPGVRPTRSPRTRDLGAGAGAVALIHTHSLTHSRVHELCARICCPVCTLTHTRCACIVRMFTCLHMFSPACTHTCLQLTLTCASEYTRAWLLAHSCTRVYM